MNDQPENRAFTMGRRSISIKRYDGSELKRCGAIIFSAPPNPDVLEGEPPYTIIEAVKTATALSNAQLSLGHDFRINYVSDGVLNVTGYFRDELMGQTLSTLLPETMSLVKHNRLMRDRFPNASQNTYLVALIAAPELPEIPRRADRDKQHRCFFSYSRAGSAAHAARIVQFLKERGLEVWFDLEEINYGANFESKLYEGVAQSERFCFPLCREYLQSTYCRVELEAALEYNKPILPIIQSMDAQLIEDFHDLFPDMKKINWVEFIPGSTSPARAIASIADFITNDEMFHTESTARLAKAIAWKKNKRASSLLLSSDSSALGEAWLMLNASKQSLIPPIVSEHITVSRSIAASHEKKFKALIVIALAASIVGFMVSLSLYQLSRQSSKELEQALVLAEARAHLADGNYAVLQRFTRPCHALRKSISSLESTIALEESLQSDDYVREEVSQTISFLRTGLLTIVDGSELVTAANVLEVARQDLSRKYAERQCEGARTN